MADEDKKTVVELAKERFERCKEAYAASRALAIEDTKFALGDSDNGWQWPQDIRNSRTGEKRPCLTVNLTAQHCNQIINNIRQNRPQVRVLPVDNKSDKKSAEIMAGLIRNIQASSNAEDAHDTAAEHSIYGGEGYWRVVTEYESETSFQQCIKIKPIVNPLLVYIDCDAIELDKSDAKYGFIFEDIPKSQIKLDHPDIDASSWVDDRAGWIAKDTIRRAEYFWCEDVADTALLMPDGTSVLKSQQPEAEALAVKTRATTRKQWYWCKLLGGHDEPIDKTEWAGKYLPIVSVVGKEVNVNGEIVRKGIVRDLKDPARMVNYSYSAAIETVALQNKVPYMAAAEALEGYEDIWQRANNENRSYLPYNAFDENGNAIPMPARQPPAVMPAAQVQMLQLSTEQMRAASGQQNANFGIKSEAASGVGIQRLKVQGETATFHFPDNQVRGLRYEAKLLIDLIPKIYDTKRVIRILGLDGSDEQAVLDPEAPGASVELKAQEGEISKIFNPTFGTYDVAIDTGPSFQTQRQEAAANLTELVSKNPALMQIAGDLVMRSYDFPMADELAKRLAKAVPPELQDKEEAPEIPPQVQQAMQQMNQQMQMLQQALQEAQAAAADKSAEAEAKMGELQVKMAELELKRDELGIKKYDAETKRIQVMQAEQAAQEADEHEAMESGPDPVHMLAESLNSSNAELAQAIANIAAMQQSAQQQMSETLSGVMQTLTKPRRVNVLRDPETGRAIGAEQVMEDQ